MLWKGWLAIAKLKPLSLFISLLSMPMKAFDNVKINHHHTSGLFISEIWNPSPHGSRHRPGQWLNRTWVLQSSSWTTSVPPELCSRLYSNPHMAQAISDVVGWCLEHLCIDWIVFLCPVVSELEEGCVNAQAAFAFQIKKIPPYYNCGCAMSDVW